MKQALLNRALFAFRRVAPHTVGFASFCDVPGLDTTLAEVSCMAAFTVALLTLVPYLVISLYRAMIVLNSIICEYVSNAKYSILDKMYY